MSVRLLYPISYGLGWLVPARPVLGIKGRWLFVLRHEVVVLCRTNARPRLDWADRAILAALIRLLLARLQVRRLVSPGTVLRWRRLVTRKGTCPHRTGPLPVSAEITALIARLATENNNWRCKWIQGELLKLGCRVSAPTIRGFSRH